MQTQLLTYKEKQMTDEQKQTEVASTTPVEQPPVVEEKIIEVDIYGESIPMPISKAKSIIAKRDSKTKEYNDLKSKITIAETQAKQESERATLLEHMKRQDIAAVEEQISAKYEDTIQRFEKKVYNESIKSSLSKNGVLSDALEDSAKLVLGEAKPELDFWLS